MHTLTQNMLYDTCQYMGSAYLQILVRPIQPDVYHTAVACCLDQGWFGDQEGWQLTTEGVVGKVQ